MFMCNTVITRRMYEYLIEYCWCAGLTPNTVYRVTVRAKNIKAPHFDEKSAKHLDKLSAHTEFRTLPKGKNNNVTLASQ